eukprot:TRINITY_DN14504_c1_g1_i1.p1 TRINITY_DN14504_c1_g1~~TRINITY_DN14504_c1_g1_i1.p1  ORF type:complete len:374 (-),score=26.64 TRINITY_DN14504_c1_g1_i1:93-1214(-)
MTRSLENELVRARGQESQQKRLRELSLESSLYRQELKSQQRLSQNSLILHLLVVGLMWMKYSILVLNFLLNILILCFYDDDHTEVSKLSQSKRIAFYFLGTCGSLLSFLIVLGCILKHLSLLSAFSSSKGIERKVLWHRLKACGSVVFWISYTGVSIYGMVNWLYYSLLLIYTFLCCPLLWQFCISLLNHLWDILQVMLAVIVVVYIYSIFGYEHLHSSFEHDTCDTLYNCFTTLLNRGSRSFGGIGDVLIHNSSPHNANYWGRYWYDFTAFILVNFLLFCLLWTVVMEAAREVRRKVTACYICGGSKGELGREWENHVEREHCVGDYVCYLMHVEDRSGGEVEGYVRKLREENAVDYFPLFGSRSSPDSDKL